MQDLPFWRTEGSFKQLLEAAPDGIVIVDEAGHIVLANQRTESMFHWRREELLGQRIEVLIPERYRKRHRKAFAGYAADPRVRQMGVGLDLYGLSKDGAEIPVEISLSPFHTSDEKFFICAIRDVTVFRQANEMRQHLAAIIESSQDAVISAGTDGVIRTWNKGAEKLLGFTAEDIIGRSLATLVPPDRFAEATEILERINRGEPVTGIETERVRQDGQRIRVSLTVSPIHDSDGRVAGTSAITRDVTDRWQAEERLRQANKDLRQITYAAAHDLQEPLRNISLLLSALKSDLKRKHEGDRSNDLGLDASELVDEGLTSAQRMIAMVQGLMALSTVIGPLEREAALTDSGMVLDDVLREFYANIKSQELRVERGLLPRVRMDDMHLHQLFQHLIGNAFKYRRMGGEACVVKISAARERNEWMFAIADNGIGFDPAYAERIFGIFRRLHAGDKYPGTGIGLSICARIVSRYGGKMWADSKLGDGAVFKFTLPVERE